MKIIKEAKRNKVIKYTKDFQKVGEEAGYGYSFPCYSNGIADVNDEFYSCWKDNYRYCLDHPEEYIYEGVQKHEWNYTEPAVGLCSCGNEVVLENQYLGACQCGKCGQWYNLFGQQLIDPKYWEN